MLSKNQVCALSGFLFNDTIFWKLYEINVEKNKNKTTSKLKEPIINWVDNANAATHSETYILLIIKNLIIEFNLIIKKQYW